MVNQHYLKAEESLGKLIGETDGMHSLLTLNSAFNNYDSNNNTNNATSIGSNMGLFQYITFGMNVPFVFIFIYLFVHILLFLYRRRREFNRNQKKLYFLVLLVCVSSFFNMLTKIGSELAFLHANLKDAEILFAMLKAFDRVVIAWTCFSEFLLLSHVSFVFLSTTRDSGALSSIAFKRFKLAIIIFIITLIMVVVGLSLVLFTLGGLISRFGETQLIYYLSIIVLVLSALIFSGASISVLVFLHISGGLLLKTLQAGERRAREMQTNELMSNEQLKTIFVKKQSLKKAWIILIGVTTTLLLQFFGFIFLPLSAVNRYLILVYYAFYNVTLVVMIVLFILVNRRMSEVQKLFLKAGKDNVTEGKSEKSSTHVSSNKQKELPQQITNI